MNLHEFEVDCTTVYRYVARHGKAGEGHDSSWAQSAREVDAGRVRGRIPGAACRNFLTQKRPITAWRCGREDADTEAIELARHSQVLAEGREDDYPEAWGLPFDAGRDARVNGVPFDEGRTEPWKEGWIAADINMGIANVEE